MARSSNERLLLPSVLDRLLDYEPEMSREAVPTANQLLRDLKQSVRRDLENLLNTRARLLSWPAHLRELQQSLINYGLPDFTGVNLGSSKDRDDFCRVIQAIINQLEPRLIKVSVVPLTTSEPLDRTFRFRIDAMLRTEPAPEPIVFDSNVEPATGDVKIREVAG
jgi:type VI secretion system protein ImpF